MWLVTVYGFRVLVFYIFASLHNNRKDGSVLFCERRFHYMIRIVSMAGIPNSRYQFRMLFLFLFFIFVIHFSSIDANANSFRKTNVNIGFVAQSQFWQLFPFSSPVQLFRFRNLLIRNIYLSWNINIWCNFPSTAHAHARQCGMQQFQLNMK